ncbi:alpha-tectorin-like [Xenopus laevis]|uniref:Alpha-tectorin-like n=1 Tax=Xenopus laevis TaxID=8355 RepID=A0A8J1KU11_XENLA|nr:alpha-tectorin-like [Xenopus laevis]
MSFRLPRSSTTTITTTTTTTTTVKPPPSSGSCVVTGDPHYYSFDKRVFDFMGICTYTLSKLCQFDKNLVDFNVEAKNEYWPGNTRVSYVRYVNVDVHGYRITLEQNREVKVDGKSVILPTTLPPEVKISYSGHHVMVTTSFGLSVLFDGNHRAEVKLYDTYSNQVCGLCGNFNGNETDDFLNPSGQLEKDPVDLGNSWQVENDTRLVNRRIIKLHRLKGCVQDSA